MKKNEVKPMDNIDKNPQRFQGTIHEQNEILPSYTL